MIFKKPAIKLAFLCLSLCLLRALLLYSLSWVFIR